MKKIAKPSFIFFMIATLLVIPFGFSALAEDEFETEQPGGGAMIYDFLVMRPVGIISTAVGSVFFVISYPFAALGGNTDMAKEKLVKDPFNYTFKRPLGAF